MIRETKEVKEFLNAAAAGGTAVILFKRDDGSRGVIDFTDLIGKQLERTEARMLCETPEEVDQPAEASTQEQEKKKPGRGGKPKVDHGKIMALHNAGWSGPRNSI